MTLKAPFPYFGGKRRAATLVWDALGPVDHYVEPFCGSAAVQLTGEGDTWQTTYAPAPTPAQAWAHAAADLRADAERELAAMAARVDRIGKALEVE